MKKRNPAVLVELKDGNSFVRLYDTIEASSRAHNYYSGQGGVRLGVSRVYSYPYYVGNSYDTRNETSGY